MTAADTEIRLRDWRHGSTQAERLTAALLHLEGFKEVDPQHPLGGPDGLKDVLCRKDGLLWVAASYFPATSSTFAQIKKKFENDFEGVSRNGTRGFAFFVNQQLTIGQRDELLAIAGGVRTEVFHLERMCSVLNAPRAYGVRFEYLRIPMAEAEQLAFFSDYGADIARRLAHNERKHATQIRKLDQKLDTLIRRTSALETDVHANPSSLSQAMSPDASDMPTAWISSSMLSWLHRILTEDSLPESIRGRYRAVQVWVGPPGSGPDNARIYMPPPPGQIQPLVLQFTSWWRERHASLRIAPTPEVALGLAEFHHRFLQIHPFLDGNGRVARSLLDQATRELCNQSIGPGFTATPQNYFGALSAADKGDLVPLQQLIMTNLQ